MFRAFFYGIILIMKGKIPKIIHPYLWFNDIELMDLEKDKQRIILNVLNYGSFDATKWLFDNYSKNEIRQIVKKQGAKGELDKKSLNYWCLVLEINPKTLVVSRF